MRKEGGGRVEEIYPAGASDIKERFFVFLCQTAEKRATWLLTVHSDFLASRAVVPGEARAVSLSWKNISLFPRLLFLNKYLQNLAFSTVKFQHIGVD